MIRFGFNDLLVGAAILCVLLLILWRQKRSLSYLLFFSVFWLYLLAVVSVVIFPFAVNMGTAWHFGLPSINLVPFRFDSCTRDRFCSVDILSNIALTIPFGFGINFLARIKPRNLPWLALGVGMVFELSQLAISLAFHSGFRSVDINDVLLNASGVLIGYVLFRVFGRTCESLAQFPGIPHTWLFAEVYDIVRQAAGSRGSNSGDIERSQGD